MSFASSGLNEKRHVVVGGGQLQHLLPQLAATFLGRRFLALRLQCDEVVKTRDEVGDSIERWLFVLRHGVLQFEVSGWVFSFHGV
jgi:hypothetical protein